MKRAAWLVIGAVMLVILACGTGLPNPNGPLPTVKSSIFDSGRTAYGFFPTPPEVSTESVIQNMKAIGKHADVALFQQEILWADFIDNPWADSKGIDDLGGMVRLALSNGLEPIFVVDPLDGLDRRNF